MQSNPGSPPPPLPSEEQPPTETAEVASSDRALNLATRGLVVSAGLLILLLAKVSLGASLTLVILGAGVWWCIRRDWPSWWLVGGGYFLLATVGVFFFGFTGPEVWRATLHKSVRTYQLRAAFDQFLLDHPERIFVRFEDLVGPDSYMKAAPPVDGEDYRAMFPLRCDAVAMPVVFRDGWQVILFRGHLIVRRPDGRYVDRHLSSPGVIEEYKQFLAEQHRPDGMHRTTLVDPPELKGRRFDTAFRGGVPDGRFRAYYSDGRLWGEATYQNGRLVGRHQVFSPNGEVVFETHFAP